MSSSNSLPIILQSISFLHPIFIICTSIYWDFNFLFYF